MKMEKRWNSDEEFWYSAMVQWISKKKKAHFPGVYVFSASSSAWNDKYDMTCSNDSEEKKCFTTFAFFLS